MSYDLRILGDGLDRARARGLLRAAGAEGEDDELVLEREGVVAELLLSPDAVDAGVTTTGEGDPARGFAELLDTVFALAHELGARVYDPQVGRELEPADADDARRAFG